MPAEFLAWGCAHPGGRKAQSKEVELADVEKMQQKLQGKPTFDFLDFVQQMPGISNGWVPGWPDEDDPQ